MTIINYSQWHCLVNTDFTSLSCLNFQIIEKLSSSYYSFQYISVFKLIHFTIFCIDSTPCQDMHPNIMIKPFPCLIVNLENLKLNSILGRRRTYVFPSEMTNQLTNNSICWMLLIELSIFSKHISSNRLMEIFSWYPGDLTVYINCISLFFSRKNIYCDFIDINMFHYVESSHITNIFHQLT